MPTLASHAGNAIPIHHSGRRALLFPSGETRSIAYNWQNTWRTAVVEGAVLPRLYWRMRFLATQAFEASDNAMFVLMSKTMSADAAVPAWEEVTQYINLNARSPISADTVYNIALDLTNSFSALTYRKSADFDTVLLRQGDHVDDNYAGDIIILNTRIAWLYNQATVDGETVFATLLV